MRNHWIRKERRGCSNRGGDSLSFVEVRLLDNARVFTMVLEASPVPSPFSASVVRVGVGVGLRETYRIMTTRVLPRYSIIQV